MDTLWMDTLFVLLLILITGTAVLPHKQIKCMGCDLSSTHVHTVLPNDVE
jgi:hypothetical protein